MFHGSYIKDLKVAESTSTARSYPIYEDVKGDSVTVAISATQTGQIPLVSEGHLLANKLTVATSSNTSKKAATGVYRYYKNTGAVASGYWSAYTYKYQHNYSYYRYPVENTYYVFYRNYDTYYQPYYGARTDSYNNFSNGSYTYVSGSTVHYSTYVDTYTYRDWSYRYAISNNYYYFTVYGTSYTTLTGYRFSYSYVKTSYYTDRYIKAYYEARGPYAYTYYYRGLFGGNRYETYYVYTYVVGGYTTYYYRRSRVESVYVYSSYTYRKAYTSSTRRSAERPRYSYRIGNGWAGYGNDPGNEYNGWYANYTTGSDTITYYVKTTYSTATRYYNYHSSTTYYNYRYYIGRYGTLYHKSDTKYYVTYIDYYGNQLYYAYLSDLSYAYTYTTSGGK